MRLRSVSFGLLLAASVATSCSSGRVERVEAAGEVASPLQVAQRIPRFQRALATARLADEAGVVHAPTSTGTRTLGARLPSAGDDSFRVFDAEDPDGFWVELVPLATAPHGLVRDGRAAVAREVAKDTDAIHFASATVAEELRVLRSPAASPTSRYALKIGPHVASVRLRDGRVQLADGVGYVRLSTLPAIAVDARGLERAVTVTLRETPGHGFTLETTLDTRDLAFPVVVDPVWTSAANMGSRRQNHAFFTLLDGRAVAAGTGDAMLGPSFSSEAYTASTNTWTSLGPTAQRIDAYGVSGVGIMKGSRAGYGLIIGAYFTNFAGGMLSPATNTWAATPIPPVSLDRSTLVLLSDGATVLAVPGLHASAQKFDSTAGTAATPGAWTATATMKAVRLDHAAVLLPNGNVLVCGGRPDAGSAPVATAEIYDPTANTWTLTNPMPGARYGHEAVLAGGRVLVTGGNNGTSETNTSWWFDSATSTWTSAGNMASARSFHVAALTPTSKVLVVGGNSVSTAEIYDPAGTAWAPAGGLSELRPGARGTTISTGVLVSGGDDPSSPSPSSAAELFRALGVGSLCVAASECDSGFCVNGVCCGTSACPSGQRCDYAPKKGTCSLPQGAACSTAGACASSLCVDARCCDSACGNQCEACNVAGKEGTCSPVIGGPVGGRAACPGATSSDPCAKKYCDGVSRVACAFAPAGSVQCGANACTGGVETHLAKCNGGGACGDVPKACGDYTCAAGGLCLTSCTANADCVTGRYCDATRGACMPYEGLGRRCGPTIPCSGTLACVNGFCCGTASCPDGASCGVPGKEGTCTRVNGSACTADAQCGSGHCVDGVCCDRACDGQCEACDVRDPVTGLAGKCIPVTGVPHGARTPCAAGADVCDARQCDGATAASCEGLVGSDVVCRTASCADGSLTLEAQCDGAGACPAAIAKPCGGFACTLDGLGCETTCASDAQCAKGHRCEGGACVVPTQTCSNDGTQSIAKDGTSTPCFPYACRTDGTCGSTCTVTPDCAPGRICADRACVETATTSSVAEGGCSMGVRSGRGPGAASLVLLGLVLGAALLRRRAARFAGGAVLATVGAASCSQRATPETGTAPAPASAPAPRDARAVVSELHRFGWLSAGLDRVHPIVRRGGGYVQAARGALTFEIPARADGTTRIVAEREPAAWVEIRATDLGPRDAEITEGAVVYAGATDDVVIMPSPGRLEEVRVVREARASIDARYALRVGPGIATVRVREGHVELVDAKGYVQLSTEPMIAFDADGRSRRVEISLAQDGGSWSLKTRLDTAGLAWPIAVDPAWTAVASMNAARSSPSVVALPDGRAMAIAGDILGLQSADSELFDPATNTWTTKKSLLIGRKWQCAAVIQSGALAGRAMVIGGDSAAQTETEIYDVATDTWTTGPVLKAARTSATAVAVGAKVLVANGASAELIDPVAGTSTLSTGSLTAQPTSLVPLSTGKVLMVGTSSAPNLYDPATNAISAAAAMPSALSSIGAAASGSKVLVTGVTTALLYDAGANTWTTTGAPLESVFGPLAFAVGTASRVMLVGGGASTNTEWWDPATGTFATSGFYSRARSGLGGVKLADGSLLIAGGASGPTRVYATADRWIPGVLGNGCAHGYDCTSGYCTDGVCCTTSTCASGAVCNRAKSLGTCSKALGIACAASAECESGSCVDGVCCNTACTEQCSSCKVAGQLGTCVAISGSPVAPRAACASGGTTAPCATKSCDGFDGAQCHFSAAGTPACGTAGCAAGVATTAGTCNGAGACNQITKSCGAYACSGNGCAATCASNTDCATGFYCDAATGACVADEGTGQKCSATVPCQSGLTCVDGVCCSVDKCPAGATCGWFGHEGACIKFNGSTCGADAECGSGHCVDGVCCDTACSGQCEACDIVEAATGRSGRCLPTVGAPRGGREACASDPSNVCSGSQCGGEDRTKCTMLAGSSTACRRQSCKDGVLTLPAQCDGKGGCPAVVTATCDAYACTDDGTRCRTSCTAEAGCAAGFFCLHGTCEKRAAECSQDLLSSTPSGGSPVSCAPYRCIESGACGTSCRTTDDCASGRLCDSTGTCVPPAASSDGGGCAYGHGSSAGLGALAVALSLGALRRRRAR